MLCLNAFGYWESTASGRFELGAAVTPPSLELVVDSGQDVRGTVSGGWDERAIVFLGGGVPGAWGWG